MPVISLTCTPSSPGVKLVLPVKHRVGAFCPSHSPVNKAILKVYTCSNVCTKRYFEIMYLCFFAYLLPIVV